MAGPTLEKHTAFGFQIQSAEGSEVYDSVLWVPFNDTLDFKLRTNRTPYRQADYNDYLHMLYSGGIWAEGGAPVSFIPDATVWAALKSWLMDRDAYNQGKFASVYIYDTARGIRAFKDVKVREFAFRFTRGEPVRLDLQLVGKGPGSGNPTPDLSGRRIGPFLWKETVVEIDYGGLGSMSVSVDIEGAEVRGDNMIHTPEEGMRITSTVNGPVRLYNIGGQNVTGSFTRDFVDSTVYDIFVALGSDDFGTTYDGQLKFTLTRGGVSAEILVNRFQLTDHAADPAGTNEGRIVETVEWQGLGSTDGATAPLTLT